MSEINAIGIMAVLRGGPRDGEEVALMPAMSYGPPLQLTYLAPSPEGEQPFSCWDVYRQEKYLPVWPLATAELLAMRESGMTPLYHVVYVWIGKMRVVDDLGERARARTCAGAPAPAPTRGQG